MEMPFHTLKSALNLEPPRRCNRRTLSLLLKADAQARAVMAENTPSTEAKDRTRAEKTMPNSQCPPGQ
eukprot:s35_g13.t1